MAGRKSKLTPALQQEIVQAWDRRDGETIKAYEAFTEYRNMGVQRSIRQLAEQKQHKNHTTIRDWSIKYEWVKRVESWDEHQIKQMDETRAEQRKRLVERELADYERMLNKFDQVWDTTRLHERHVKKFDEEKQTWYEIVELNVDDWQKLTRWRDDISKQGRRALGLPDKISESKTDLTSGGEKLNWPSIIKVVKPDDPSTE